MNQYLKTLELDSSATKKEIKSAYRRLSKRYHPDVSTDEHAKENFIRINEAYRFLTDVGPVVQEGSFSSDAATYDYDPSAAAYDQWREKAKKYAQWKAQEAQKRQTELIKIILGSFDFVSVFILVFNLTLVMDFFLPKQEITFDSFSIRPIIEKRVYRYDDVVFGQYVFRLDAGRVDELRAFDSATVFSTVFFDLPFSFQLSKHGRTQMYEPIYNIYHVFGYAIPLIFVFIGLYKFGDFSLDNQLTIALFLFFLAVFQLYILY